MTYDEVVEYLEESQYHYDYEAETVELIQDIYSRAFKEGHEVGFRRGEREGIIEAFD